MFVYASTPNVAVADGFVYPEECQKIIEASRDSLVRSTTSGKDGNEVNPDRTSTSIGLPHSDFPEVCERISGVANMPLENAEHIQVVRYTKDQEYKPHYDAFKDDQYKKDGGQRLLTCLVYLNNSVGIGEHSGLIDEVKSWTEKLTEAEENIETIKRHFP